MEGQISRRNSDMAMPRQKVTTQLWQSTIGKDLPGFFFKFIFPEEQRNLTFHQVPLLLDLTQEKSSSKT